MAMVVHHGMTNTWRRPVSLTGSYTHMVTKVSLVLQSWQSTVLLYDLINNCHIPCHGESDACWAHSWVLSCGSKPEQEMSTWYNYLL